MPFGNGAHYALRYYIAVNFERFLLDLKLGIHDTEKHWPLGWLHAWSLCLFQSVIPGRGKKSYKMTISQPLQIVSQFFSQNSFVYVSCEIERHMVVSTIFSNNIYYCLQYLFNSLQYLFNIVSTIFNLFLEQKCMSFGSKSNGKL